MFTAARLSAGTVIAGIALTALGACSSAHQPGLAAGGPPAARTAARPTAVATVGPTTSTTSTPSAAAATTAPAQPGAPAPQPVPVAPSPLPSLSAVPAAPTGFTAACAPAALLAYVNTQQRPAAGFGETEIYNCVGGYARLYAKANPDSTGKQPDGDQFFLQYADGRWTTLARGAAIDCGDGLPALLQACAVFGAAAIH